jgi:hypothetical protein
MILLGSTGTEPWACWPLTDAPSRLAQITNRSSGLTEKLILSTQREPHHDLKQC